MIRNQLEACLKRTKLKKIQSRLDNQIKLFYWKEISRLKKEKKAKYT